MSAPANVYMDEPKITGLLPSTSTQSSWLACGKFSTVFMLPFQPTNKLQAPLIVLSF